MAVIASGEVVNDNFCLSDAPSFVDDGAADELTSSSSVSLRLITLDVSARVCKACNIFFKTKNLVSPVVKQFYF